MKAANAAFSLVEVLCAITLLGLALVGLTQGITTALVSSKESELQTSAALLAAGRIEILRAEGYLLEGEDEGGGDPALFRWKQSVRSTGIDGLYEVSVTVEHSKSGEVVYELQTLLFDPPLSSTWGQEEDNQPSRTNRRRP